MVKKIGILMIALSVSYITNDCLFAALPSGMVDESSLRDPTRPLDYRDPRYRGTSDNSVANDKSDDVAKPLILNAIFKFDGSSVAIINGNPLTIGQRYDDLLVEKIGSHKVVLRKTSGKGEVVELKIYPQLIKQK